MQQLGALAIAGIVTVSVAGYANAGERLSTRAIKQLFPGQFSAVVKGYKVHFKARRDGSLVGSYMAATDTGRWSIRRGRLCIMLKDWMKGETSCSSVVQVGSWYKANDVKFRKL